MKKFLIYVSLTLAAVSCNSNKTKPADTKTDTSGGKNSVNNTENSLPEAWFRSNKDSILIEPFDIELSLSPKAVARLQKGNETIIVAADLSGTPKDSSKVTLEEDGSFFVASVSKEIHYGDPVRFDNIKFPKKIYDELADKNIDLGINVYTGRKTSPDNLLDCQPLFDKISNVVNKKFTLKGKLIYGDD